MNITMLCKIMLDIFMVDLQPVLLLIICIYHDLYLFSGCIVYDFYFFISFYYSIKVSKL